MVERLITHRSHLAAKHQEALMAANEGIAYILTNEAVPGFVRVEFTEKDDLASEIRKINKTSMPLPFEVYFAAKVPDYRRLEGTLHWLFGQNRATRSREFFKISPDIMKVAIELVASSVIELSDREQGIEAGERKEIRALRAKREAQIINALNIPRGTILTLMNDEKISCTYVGRGKVNFEGKEMIYSDAALKAVQKMGYAWNTVCGLDLWFYDGVSLADLEKIDGEIFVDTGESEDSVFFSTQDLKKDEVNAPFIVLK